MQFDLVCMECQLRRQRIAAETQPDRKAARKYLQDCLKIIAEAPPGVAAPWLAPRFAEAWKRYFPPVDRYEAEKKAANQYALSREEALRARIEAGSDSLYTALTLSRVGNYLDFAALGDTVSFETLDVLTEKALEDAVDPAEYRRFCEDCEKAERFLLLTDNAGEILYDKLLLEQMSRRWPHLKLTAGLRGGPALNDATREDAQMVGLSDTARLIDTGVPIPGTQLNACSEAFQKEFQSADVILAKGQGNFETLWGCGANVYYLFLCKCVLFTELFHVPQLTGMFVNERRTAAKSSD